MYWMVKGRVRIMAYDERRNRFRFFRPSAWERMKAEKKAKYQTEF